MEKYIRSLFFRMRMVHWIGELLLVANALLLTDNLWSQVIQITVAVVIVFHDLDEKVSGVNVAKKIIAQLENIDFSKPIDLNLGFSLEYKQMVDLVNKFTEQVYKATQVGKASQEINESIKKLNESLESLEQIFAETKKNNEKIIEFLCPNLSAKIPVGISTKTIKIEYIDCINKIWDIVKPLL